MAWVKTGYTGAAALAGGLSSSLFGSDTGGNSEAMNAALAKQGQIADKQLAIGNERWKNYQTNFQPIEGDYATLALDAGGLDAQEKAAGMASAGVEQAFGNTEGQLNRSMSRNGVNQSSGNAIEMRAGLALAKAKARAGASTIARQNEKDRGFTMKGQALGVGNSIDGTSDLNSASAGLSSVISGNGAAVSAGNAQNAAIGTAVGTLAQKGLEAWKKP